AIVKPDDVDTSVDKVIAHLEEQVREAKASSSVLGTIDVLEPSEAQRLMTHPLPHWVERMTVNYLNAHGGKAERKRRTWNLTWPDGETMANVVFNGKEAGQSPTSRHLTLDDSRVRGLAMKLPQFVPGQPISVVTISGITNEVTGLWSLWRIGITTMEWNRHRIMPLFITDGGKVFAPTARHLWDKLLGVRPNVRTHLDMEESKEAFDRLAGIAEEQGRTIYDELVQEHRSRLTREREKGEYAFAARRSVIERVGLPQVRDHRLNLLTQEEKASQEQLDQKAHAFPEMVPLLIVRVEGGV
ncbi:MAG TPA: helicase, partial [Desulfobacterales bacterium]|nr:helicase [Desulfobacterales bacterium]